jgi:GDP-L-fucose synthase
MKIILTGGSGFLGKFVHQELLRRDYRDIFVPRSKLIDLTKFDQAQEMIRYYRPDTIIHLAAEVGGIGANMANPGRFFYANMSMGLNLIEASRLYHVNKFVQVGTVCAYPKICSVPFVEEDIWNGYPEETNAPYGVAKKALFVMLEAYKKQYGLNSCVIVPTNLYGPFDNFDPESSHVIPALIRKFIIAKKHNFPNVSCWGDGSATREFLYVEDAARAIVNGMERVKDPTPINVGSGKEISILLLADKIKELVNYSGDILWDSDKPNGQPRRVLNIAKAKQLLDWEPKKEFVSGLKTTIEWYLSTKLYE